MTEEPDRAMAREEASCDQEALVLNRLTTLVEIVLSLESDTYIVHHKPAYRRAIKGAIHGMAEEMLNVFDLAPSYTNIQEEK